MWMNFPDDRLLRHKVHHKSGYAKIIGQPLVLVQSCALKCHKGMFTAS
jgi:hypothetical protein